MSTNDRIQFDESLLQRLQYCEMIMVDTQMVERRAYPRSPARAKRRAALGHPQHSAIRPIMQVHCFEECMTMHPEVFEQMKAYIERMKSG